MKRTLILVCLWIVAVNTFGFAAENRLNLRADTAYTWITPEHFPPTQNWDIIDLHDRWDTYWYLDIVRHGYYTRTDDTLSDVAFFPLYPFLITILGTIFFGHFVFAGWIISAGFLLLAARYFYKLMKEFHQDINPKLPILFMLAFPTAFFLNVVYTESLFLFLSLGCFYFAFRKRFFLAGAFAFFGALAHSNGIFLGIPILWELLRINGWKVVFTRKIFPVFLPAIATISFFSFNAFKFHDPFLFFKLESAWGRSFAINKSHFLLFSHPAIINLAIDSIFTAVIITAIILVYRRLSPLYAVYMSATVLAALTSGTLMSIGRYSLVLFPLFILLASVKNEIFRIGWLFTSTLFLALDITLFVSNYWAG